MGDELNGNEGRVPPGARAPKAYLNAKFLRSHDARVLRILSEYLEPLQRFNRSGVRETLVFFC